MNLRQLRLLRIIAITTGVAAAVLVIGAVWWWALIGMAPEIGTAVGVTAFTLTTISALVATGGMS